MELCNSPLRLLAPLLLLAPLAEARQVAQMDSQQSAFQPEQGLTGPLAAVVPQINLDRVWYDRPGDGSLWVRGANYKARFGKDAVEFVPFLGSAAPRNFPVTFKLGSIQVGDAALAVRCHVEPTREGHEGQEGEESNVVSYDRGSVVEYYVIESGSIEQRFRLARPMAAAGDLVIRVDVGSELSCSEDSDGFCFAGELGGVRYGRALTFDAVGKTVSSPTRLVDGGIEIRVAAEFLATAQYPLTVDPFISTFTADDSANSTSNPDVAFDVTNQTYCVTWEFAFSQSDYDIYSELRGTNGSLGLGSEIWIDASTADWKRPKVANNNLADQFLIVAINGGFSGVISGRTRSAVPNSMSPQFQISGVGEIGLKTNPDVGGDPSGLSPSYYCVVWESQRDGFSDIHARRVSGSSQTFGNTFSIDSSSGYNSHPSISKSCGMPPRNSQRWTIAWMRYAAPGNNDIFGSQVSWEGQVTHQRFAIDTSSSNDRWPSVTSVLDGASGERPYLVAWYDGADISGKALRGSTSLTPRTNLTALEGGANLYFPQLSPAVESDGSTFVMAYAEDHPATGHDIYVAEYDYAAGQLVCTDPNRRAAGSFPSEQNPFLVSERSGGGSSGRFMAVWHQLTGTGNTDVEGAMLYSQSFGHVFCETNPNSTGFPGQIRIQGSRSLANDSMRLSTVACPPNKPGLFFTGAAQVNTPFGEGRRCVGGATRRMPLTSTDGIGMAIQDLDLSAPYASGIVAGTTSNYQFWFRDPTGGPAGFNLTSGLAVEHTP